MPAWTSEHCIVASGERRPHQPLSDSQRTISGDMRVATLGWRAPPARWDGSVRMLAPLTQRKPSSAHYHAPTSPRLSTDRHPSSGFLGTQRCSSTVHPESQPMASPRSPQPSRSTACKPLSGRRPPFYTRGIHGSHITVLSPLATRPSRTSRVPRPSVHRPNTRSPTICFPLRFFR